MVNISNESEEWKPRKMKRGDKRSFGNLGSENKARGDQVAALDSSRRSVGKGRF